MKKNLFAALPLILLLNSPLAGFAQTDAPTHILAAKNQNQISDQVEGTKADQIEDQQRAEKMKHHGHHKHMRHFKNMKKGHENSATEMKEEQTRQK